MAEKVTIARPYAEAAFQLAKASSSQAAWNEVLQRLAAIAEIPEVLDCTGNPRLECGQLVDLFARSAGQSLTPEQLEFLQVLASNDRLDVLPEIALLYEKMKNCDEGVRSVSVETAYPMDAATLQSLVKDLEQKYGGSFQATVSVVPELIGGVCIAIGDDVIDASVRGKLAVMATALKS